MMTLEQFKEKLNTEYDMLVQRGLDWSIEHDENEHVYFLNHAYEYAHYNEILAYFEDMEEDDWDENWRELVNKCIHTDRVLRGVYEFWLDFSHPERFNFFCYEDLISIIKDWFKIYGGK